MNIVLGILLIGVAVFFLLRKPTKVEEEVVSTVEAAGESEPKREPTSGRAFLTGLIVYSPGLGLIAAVKALHDANYSVGLLAVGVIICTVIVLWMAEVPIIATAISPVRSGPLLRKGGDFIARNTRLISWLIAAGYRCLSGHRRYKHRHLGLTFRFPGPGCYQGVVKESDRRYTPPVTLPTRSRRFALFAVILSAVGAAVAQGSPGPVPRRRLWTLSARRG